MWNEDRAQAARWAEGPARVRPPWMRVDTPRPGHTWELPPGFTPCARPGAAGGRDAPRHVTPREAGIREGRRPARTPSLTRCRVTCSAPRTETRWCEG